MRFPGDREAKHYFPVHARGAAVAEEDREEAAWNVVGIDQILVDEEVRGPQNLATKLGLAFGESVRLSPDDASRVEGEIANMGLSAKMAPGGSVANTLSNYTFLSGEQAVLLGSVPETIRFGSPAFQYVAQTPRALDLTHLVSRPGRIGTALTLVSPDGERTFAVSPGVANDYGPDDLPRAVVENAAAVVACLYTLADASWPIAQATRRLLALAADADVPVAFGLGTAGLVRDRRDTLIELLAAHVNVAAMNEDEAEALTGEADPLLACQRALDWVDLAIVTCGPDGLILGGWTDERHRRESHRSAPSAAIPDFNRYEFSRMVCKAKAQAPQKAYSHIHPFRGGPDRLVNTNGAGDAALAAILHDIAANRYHQAMVPESPKHTNDAPFLTYSSLSRNAQYGNRVAYEVLRRRSPRLLAPVGADDE